MHLTRTLEPFIKKVARSFPVLLITGPRQVGKATLFKHLAYEEGGKRIFVTLDDPNALLLAGEDPRQFFERFPPPVIVDEIQYAPGLFPYIKMHVDKHK